MPSPEYASVLAAVPIKPFGVAKARLAPRLRPAERAALGRAIAARTLAVAARVAGEVAVVTGDDAVAEWATGRGTSVIPERRPGLDAAAQAAVRVARARSAGWAVIHADLPLLEEHDLAAVLAAAAGRGLALAPSRDGGTNVIAGFDPFDFAYGPGSFHRHLRRASAVRPAIVSRMGTAADLDTVADLTRIATHPAGAWIARYLP